MVTTQHNHVCMAIFAVFTLECLPMRHKLNHLALRAKLVLKATRKAYEQCQAMRAASGQSGILVTTVSRARRAVSGVQAADGYRFRTHHRRGSLDALAASRVESALAYCLHPDCRGDRTDSRHWRVGADARLLPKQIMAAGGTVAVTDGSQPLGATVPSRRPVQHRDGNAAGFRAGRTLSRTIHPAIKSRLF